MREWVKKFESGEYLREWRGFSPFWLGCFYGDSVMLGGEEEFSHCYDFFSGIGDVEWWITEEIEKLTEEQKDRMYSIMTRNKSVDVMLDNNRDIFYELAHKLNIGSEYIYRLGNKLRKELIESDNPIEKYKEFLKNKDVLNRLSLDDETYKQLVGINILSPKKEQFPIWYMNGMIPKMIMIDIDYKEMLELIEYDKFLPDKEELENVLGYKI
jgi:hypothetical protein